MTEKDIAFAFKFNLHKSTIFSTIADCDYERLRLLYGVSAEWMQDAVAKIEENNVLYAEKLNQQIDLSPLKAHPLKIAFLGDSNTSNRESYLNILKKATAKFENLTLSDAAISGQTSGDLFESVYSQTLPMNADIAHIMIGTNDVYQISGETCQSRTNPSEFEKNLDFIVSALSKSGCKVILTTIPPCAEEKATRAFAVTHILRPEEARQAFNQILARVAEKYNAVFNSMDALYAPYSADALTLPDGVHLNVLGQSILAQGVTKALLDLCI